MRILLEKGQLLLRPLPVEQAVLAVESRLCIARLPLRGKTAVRMLERPLDGVVIHGLEMLNLALAPHDERQRRRLHAAHGQHELIVARPPRSQGIGAREIHADKPVRPRPRESRLLEIEEILVVAQMAVGLADALFVQRIQQDAAHGLLVADIVQHFIDEQLALAVRVAAMHDFIGLVDERLHDGELLLAILVHVELPVLRDDRQILRAPALVLRVVFLRLRLA